jgi:hypothetical protein
MGLFEETARTARNEAAKRQLNFLKGIKWSNVRTVARE